MFSNGRNAVAESQNYFPHPHFFRNTRTTAPRRRAAVGEALFQGRQAKNKSISPSNAICPAHQKTGQSLLAARFLMVRVYFYVTYQLLSLLFTGHGSLSSAHCSLLILQSIPLNTQKKSASRSYAIRKGPSAPQKSPSAPKRNSPAQAPGHTVFAIPYAFAGACAGEGLAGGGLEGPASPQEAGPSKVFSRRDSFNQSIRQAGEAAGAEIGGVAADDAVVVGIAI